MKGTRSCSDTTGNNREICNDNIDNDCDGTTDCTGECSLSVDYDRDVDGLDLSSHIQDMRNVDIQLLAEQFGKLTCM